jgi:carboxyl-terminal processing protease
VFCARAATAETARPSFVASASVKASCEKPRVGASQYTSVAFPDRQGTLNDEKSWLRSYSDETYLWYREIPNVNAANYPTADAWFNALKTPALALSGAPKDRFHFTESTEDVESENAGVSFGYGLSFVRTSSGLPRKVYVTVVTPGSPADVAGVKRGDLLVSVDGADFQNGDTQAAFDTINKGLFPSVIGESHNIVFAPFNGGAQRSVVLAAASVALRPVPVSGIVTTPTGRVGYINFATFGSYVAEKAIADAMAGLVAAGGVTDLVLDLRYNGGGYVFISAETAFMIAGQARTGSKTFELYKTNDKKPFGAEDSELFYNVGSGAPGGVTQGVRLPSLNLGRVFVLTQGGTCSASESLINGLRGIDVEVVLIGGQTCGKPYGFQSTDNCGVTYSTIQVTGVNNKGEGDFIDGFAPTCKANDDLGGALGDPAEKQLAAALKYRATGVCAPVAASTSISDNSSKKAADRNTASEVLGVRETARRADTEKLMTPKNLDRSSGVPLAPAAPLNLGEVDGEGKAKR